VIPCSYQPQVSALFVDATGHYPELVGKDNCWDIVRDARNYSGPHPVVAHPPCNLWVTMPAVNWKRYGRKKPAWYQGGTDEGCFESALYSVRKYGGVLEHPAFSHAWEHHGLVAPKGSWMYVRTSSQWQSYWVCEVWQSAYGHKCRKRTWLLYCGARPPFELNWAREPGTHQVGWFDRNKPTVSKKEANLSPLPFARELVKLAQWSRL